MQSYAPPLHTVAPDLVPLIASYEVMEPGERRVLHEIVCVTLTPRIHHGTRADNVEVKAKEVWLWKDLDGVCGKFCRVRHPDDPPAEPDRILRLNEITDRWEPRHRIQSVS